MAIKEGEVGKVFRLVTSFDMSAFTALSIKFTSPTGVVKIVTDPRISAPAVDITVPNLPPLSASTYMAMTTNATDFDESGEWTACGTYTDGTPREFFSDMATFTIGDAC